MKDHEVAALVNRLRDIAVEYHAAQQLRERIAIEVRKNIDGIRQRIAALEAEKAERMNWQPIETAPKDGTNVLLYREAGNMFIVGYFDNAHGWVDGECIAPVAGPDYWCKLEPPK